MELGSRRLLQLIPLMRYTVYQNSKTIVRHWEGLEVSSKNTEILLATPLLQPKRLSKKSENAVKAFSMLSKSPKNCRRLCSVKALKLKYISHNFRVFPRELSTDRIAHHHAYRQPIANIPSEMQYGISSNEIAAKLEHYSVLFSQWFSYST